MRFETKTALGSFVLVICIVIGIELVDADGPVDPVQAKKRAAFFSTLYRNEFLIVDNLAQAYANAQEAVELAIQLDDPALREAAVLDVRLIRGMKDGAVLDLDLYQFVMAAQNEDEDSLDSRLAYHRNYMLAATAIQDSSLHAELRLAMAELGRIARGSQDADLVSQHRCFEMYIRSCYGRNGDLDVPSKSDLLEFSQDMPHSPDWDSRAVLLLMKATLEEFTEAECVEVDTLLQSSSDSLSVMLKSRLLDVKAHYYYGAKKYEIAIDIFEQKERQLKELGSPISDFNSDLKIFSMKAQYGSGDENDADAIARQISILSNPWLKKMPISAASTTMKVLQHCCRVSGLPLLAEEFGLPTEYPKHMVDDARRQTEAKQAAVTKLLNERIAKEDQLRQIELATQRSLQAQQLSLNRLRTYLLIATVIAIALLPWLFLYLQQRRLLSVKQKLATEHQRANVSEAKVDGLTERLGRIERMQSLGLMAGGIAHDFNNLLVGIIGNVELIQLMGKQAGDGFVNQRLEGIRESADKAADIARNMLAYSGRHPIERFEVKINELIEQYEGVLLSACQPTQNLVLSLEDEIVVSADRTMTERVILNLVKNAGQFSPPHGTITVSARVVSSTQLDVNSSFFGESTHQGDFAMIEVLDFGKGITDDEREHVFEPFYSTSAQGRGLGLAVVYGFVKSHNGIVQCISSIQEGTCFRVYLPLVSKTTAGTTSNVYSKPEDTEDLKSIPGGEGKTVLLVDDNEAILDVCQQLMERSGWNVLVANSGREGLEKLLQGKDEIHCALLDIVMPDMSAGEVLNELEAQQILTPVVLTSGFSKIQLETYYARPNVTAIITKPFHNQDILAALYHAAVFQECQPRPARSELTDVKGPA